jgi:enoyl-CoA hydratase/carnithine racemase
MVTIGTPSLLVADTAGVRTVALNRPERRNALSLALMRELIDVLAATAADTSIQVVVLRGEGPGFCAGHDMSEMIGCELGDYRELFDVCTELMLAIHRLPQPVIARVHGIATAAGCQLVGACDLAIADEQARFATPGLKIGLFCSTPMVEVSRAVGRKQAMELLLTGDPIDAATAVQWGLINRAVPAEELDAAVADLAQRVMRYSSRIIEIGKRAFYEQLDVPLEEAYAHTKEVMARNAAEPDAQEGMSAFLAKREPTWQGRTEGDA